MTRMILMFVVYFVMGIVMDAALTKWMAAVADKKIKMATGLSVAFTLVNFLLIAALIKDIDSNVGNVICYALGNGVGTALIMKFGK
jgi:uncharacterized protein YebE (UPF0316 family)